MPPLDSKGNSPLWEAIGRRFLNMQYDEADQLSRKNKEFILSLFPTDTIYQALLPMEARNAIGKVGRDTEPVKNMLESIGFQYTNEVDPFDGGPHYRARIDDIQTIQDLTDLVYNGAEEVSKNGQNVLIQLDDSKRDSFQAIMAPIVRSGDSFTLDSQVAKEFNLKVGEKYSLIPM